MKTYSTARAMLGAIQVVGWALVGLGVLFFLVGMFMDRAPPFMWAAGLTVSLFGFATVAGAQIGGAQIDTAISSAAILEHLTKGASSAPVSSAWAGEADHYDGVPIRRVADGFRVGENTFQTRIEAESFIAEARRSGRTI